MLDDFFAIDRLVVDDDTIQSARRVFETLRQEASRCYGSNAAVERIAHCAIETTLTRGVLRPAANPSDIASNTIAGALTSGTGSCAALVATILTLTENPTEVFDAVLLQDHVLLGATWTDTLYFETLNRGQPHRDDGFPGYTRPPTGKPLRVPAHRYLPYYADNLAARLAERGRSSDAEHLFLLAIRLDPRAGRVRFNFGTYLLLAHRFDEAAHQLRKAMRLGWEDAAVWTNLGVALWHLDHLKHARRCFEAALAQDPTNREAAANLRAIDAGAKPEAAPPPQR